MKRILVTGANKGIGLAVVRAILDEHDDAEVLLGSRSPERGAAARAGLVAERPAWDGRVEVLPIDVASDASVHAARERVREAYGVPALYGLVNNAGIGFGAQDVATIVDVNTRGVRRVCEAFLPLIDPEGGRIVNVTSASGPSFVERCSPERQRFFLDPEVSPDALEAFLEECLALDGPDAFAAQGLGDGNAYGLSKACANTYTQWLAGQHPKLAINACTPGFIETDLTRPYLERSGRSAAEVGMKSPAAGARCPLHLLFGELEGNGWYYGSDAKRSPLHRYRSPGAPPYDGR
ncbi:MAG: SDR family NAD(P)-dependent oxidoreductase [Sandaracinaceae bacterium]